MLDGRTLIESRKTDKPPELESVLVVEDNLINQKIITLQLKKNGYVIYVANHVGEALDLLAKYNNRKGKGKDGSQIAIVLLDVSVRIPTL
jgi:CheY-like chemotaxis protein